jgi:hypothetical protein
VGDIESPRLKTSQLAARQWGHVTRQQLLALRVPATTIAAWVRCGRLLRVHDGVYALGYRRVEPQARACASVLACGPTAALSHDSALALWGLRRWPTVLEVTVTGDRRPSGILVHRSTTLRASELTVQLGVRTTRAARALHDMRRRLTPRQLTRLTNDARLAHILTGDEAERLLGHRRNPTRSGIEDGFQRWLEGHALPQPVTNGSVGGREVDVLYPAQRVIVELDDYGTHGDPATFQSDRDRDLANLELGYQTVRLTPERLTDAMAVRFRRLLAARSAGRSPA